MGKAGFGLPWHLNWVRVATRESIERGWHVLGRVVPGVSRYRYWEDRARTFGARSVLNLQHTDIEAVTAMQKNILFPLLRERLTPADKLMLDFGCGPGRFTVALADAIDGRVVGVDPIQRLLDMAPKGERVEYRKFERRTIGAASASFDAVWICLVLGGIVGARDLGRCVREIDRVLKPGGLVFLVENTSEAQDTPHWKYRSVEEYRKLFPFASLVRISEYVDLGERISVLAGRKQ
jgi:SAM-dependent methyltransferase